MLDPTNSSEVFENYQQEYKTLTTDIQEKINSQLQNVSNEQKKLLINQITRELEEADEIVGQMEVELMSLPQVTRNRLTAKVKQFKDEVKNYKKELNKQSNLARSGLERDSLLGGGNSEIESRQMDQRSRLISGTERLQDEGHGISTLEELNRQREQMLRTRDTISTADAWIGKSQGVLKAMNRR
ncbi:hypothetical protein HK099_007678 [Clydaea vesicula]|uniref:Vesicle transport v-SNARE N-terminal domain-containing protein n=1 Tax=Clydaea vesicula TaxID=447962 RepID=A0AAD5TWU3_9FUNG|nr:hypothetical protein HK099_007678 [Clydaea vesicula]KAJ3380565.1 hypothetical protein HDU92_005900 [Lobulomyces angularis]